MIVLPSSYWTLKKTPGKGRGIFAKKDIEPGVVVSDYLGTFIHTSEEETYEEKFGFYSMYYHDRATIFPDVRKPGAHILNHSCTPNCYMYTYKGHTLYFALRKIFKGEELTVDYLVSPLDKYCDPCTHICNCDSPICTNSMHASKEKYDKWVAFDDRMTKNFKLPRVKYGTQLEPLPVYPKTIRDHSFYDLFGSEIKNPLVFTEAKLPSVKNIRMLIRSKGRRIYVKHLKKTILGIAGNKIVWEEKNSYFFGTLYK